VELVERYDDKLIFYTSVIERMNGTPPHHPVNCVQLCLGSLLHGIKSHAKEWLTIFGNMLQELAKSRLLSAIAYVKVCLNGLYMIYSLLTKFKSLLVCAEPLNHVFI